MNTESCNSISKPVPPLYLALWSIRHLLRAQPYQILQLIQEWNFPAVEVSVFLDWSAPKLHEKLKEHKLKVCSLTGPALNLEHEFKYYVDWAKEYLEIFETRTLVLQSTVEIFTENERSEREEACEKIADQLVEVAYDLAKSGVRVSYHCYPYDFELVNEESFISRLFKREGIPDNLGVQLDTYWLNYGRTEPDAYIKLPVHSIHLNERDQQGRCCVLGTYNVEKCAKYVLTLKENQPQIDWILENDSSDEQAAIDNKHMTDTTKECLIQWSKFWQSPTNQPQTHVSQKDDINVNTYMTVEDRSPSQTYIPEIGEALTEFLFGSEEDPEPLGFLDPLDYTYPNVKYYVVERKSPAGGGGYHIYNAERQLFSEFWPSANASFQVLHIVGGSGSGKSTFICYFFKYFLPHYQSLINDLDANSDLNKIYAKDLQRHILLCSDLRRCPPEANVRAYIFKKLRKSFIHEAKRLSFTSDLIDPNTNDEDWVRQNISLLAAQATEDKNRKWYISWILDNSDQLQESQQLSLTDVVFDYIPQEPSKITHMEPVLQGQHRNLWRVVVPIRSETRLNLETQWGPFNNRRCLDLDPIKHDPLIEKRADFIYKAVDESQKNHQEDPKRITEQRADWLPNDMADTLKDGMMAAHTFGNADAVTTKDVLNLLAELVNDSARRRLSLCSRIAFSRSFSTRKAMALQRKWEWPLVTPFYFLDGLIRGNADLFDPYDSDCLILNLYNLGVPPKNRPFSIFVGIHAIDLLRQGRQWSDIKTALFKIGHTDNDLSKCERWFLAKELIKKLWGDGHQIEFSVVKAHDSLLKERAYTDNMAQACASAWDIEEEEEIPLTDPQDPNQLLQRIKNSLWFMNKIWDAEKYLVEYSPNRFPAFDDIGQFAAFRKNLQLRCVTHYIVSEYLKRIKGLGVYEETRKVIQSNKKQWDKHLNRLKKLIDKSVSENALDVHQK